MATMKVDLGDTGVVHAVQTPRGVMFSMSEVASTIFHENPSAFAKFDVVPVLKVALMRMVTQQSATLMAKGDPENALALALDAIKQAQQIFYPKAPLQLVPLYLLAVQVCLSLGRSAQCQDLLGIAAWLFLQVPQSVENFETQAEISRLFGQLYVLQGKYEDCLAFGDVVVEIWMLVMSGLVLDQAWFPSKSFGNLDPEITPNLKNSKENIRWVHIDDIVIMLQDILRLREQLLGVSKASAEEVFFAIGLIYFYTQDFKLAFDNLNKAQNAVCDDTKAPLCDMVNKALLLCERNHKPQGWMP